MQVQNETENMGISLVLSEGKQELPSYDFPKNRKEELFTASENNYFFSAGNNYTYLCSFDEVQSINKQYDFNDAFVFYD